MLKKEEICDYCVIMYGREGAEWGRGYLQTEIDHVRIIILRG